MLTKDEFDDPARDIYKRGMKKKVNRQGGAKVSGIKDMESMLESNILVAGHIDPRVRRISPQPVTFDLNTGKRYSSRDDVVDEFKGTRYKPWIYTPDFWFELHNSEGVFVEGKHERWLESSPRFADVVEAMTGLGHRLVVVTNKAFPKDLEHNLRLLKLRTSQASHHREQKRVFEIPQPATAADVMRGHNIDEVDLLDALLDGRLRSDLHLILGPNASIEAGDGSTDHLEFLDL